MKGIFSGLCRLDELWDRVFLRVTKVWCWVTGKSNFALARVGLVVSFILLSFANIKGFVLKPGPWTAFWAMLMVSLWLWLVRRRWRFVAELENAVDAPSDVLHVDPRELHAIAIDRLIFSVFQFWMIPGVVLGVASSIGFSLYVASLYWMFQFDGGGKSLARRTADLAKKWAQKAKSLIPDLSPSPSPVPALVGVR